jgi:hypothetical protein
MKRILSALALTAMAAGANAALTFSGGTAQTIAGYDPTGGTAPQTFGLRGATIAAPNAGTLTATFLGFEAIDTDNYTFSLASGTLVNKTAIPNVTSIFGPVNAAGNLSFTFTDTTTSGSVSNGQQGAGVLSYVILGSGTVAAFTPYTMGNAYDLVLGFNDGLQVDGDYDDLVVGLRLSPIPEPESYALMLAGLGAIGFMARRRQRRNGA